MASEQEAPNCFETHMGRNVLLVSLVMSGAVLLGAEVIDNSSSDAVSSNVTLHSTAPVTAPRMEDEGVELTSYTPDYPDGTMIFVEGLGALAAVGIIVQVRKHHRSRR